MTVALYLSAGFLLGGSALAAYTYSRSVIAGKRQLAHVVGASIYTLAVTAVAILSVPDEGLLLRWALIATNVTGALAMLGVYGRFRGMAVRRST